MAAKPLISANQVTALRLVLLPIGAYCLYGGMAARYFALVFMTLVGCTDFVDGYLARKYGTTKLGSLMDPIADKVFVAVVFVPFADLGWLPTWVVGGIFIREFLVTAARTMHERRGIVLKSSYLGKVKTWFQMAGAALAFLLIAVHDKHKMLLLFGIGVGVSLLGLTASIVLRKPNQRRGALIFVGTFSILVAVEALTTPAGTLDFLGYMMLGITWLSGLDYLISGVRRIGHQLDASDAVRAIAAVAIPTLALCIVHYTRVPIWPITIVVALELSLGGLDNLLAHHRVEPSGLSWAIRSFGIVALMAAILVERPGPLSMRNGLAYALVAVSILATARMFARYSSYYIDERPARASAPPQPVEGHGRGAAA